MNLIEALRTGLPLRRPIAKHMGSNGSGWIGREWLLGVLLGQPTLFSNVLVLEDLLADDWEIQGASTAPELAAARLNLSNSEIRKILETHPLPSGQLEVPPVDAVPVMHPPHFRRALEDMTDALRYMTVPIPKPSYFARFSGIDMGEPINDEAEDLWKRPAASHCDCGGETANTTHADWCSSRGKK